MKMKKSVSYDKTDATVINQWTTSRMNGMVQCVVTIVVAVIYTRTCQNWSRLAMQMRKKLLNYKVPD